MKEMRRALGGLLVGGMIAGASLPIMSLAYTSPGQPKGFVNDFAQALTSKKKAQLEQTLQAFASGENPEVVVAIIPTLGGDAIEEYANRLFREWGVGSKTKNNGALLLVAMQDRKIRIEIGYGLEGALTDIETKHILDGVVRPRVQAGDLDEGVGEGVKAIFAALSGERAAPVEKKRPVTAQQLELILFLFVFGVSWLASILGRSKSWWAGGVIGGVTGAAAGFATNFIFWIPIAAVVGLVFDYVVSKNYRAHALDQHPAWWAGGAWGGWDRLGGGGWGGFGGGSSGGGGSSSSW